MTQKSLTVYLKKREQIVHFLSTGKQVSVTVITRVALEKELLVCICTASSFFYQQLHKYLLSNITECHLILFSDNCLSWNILLGKITWWFCTCKLCPLLVLPNVCCVLWAFVDIEFAYKITIMTRPPVWAYWYQTYILWKNTTSQPSYLKHVTALG